MKIVFTTQVHITFFFQAFIIQPCNIHVQLNDKFLSFFHKNC